MPSKFPLSSSSTSRKRVFFSSLSLDGESSVFAFTRTFFPLSSADVFLACSNILAITIQGLLKVYPKIQEVRFLRFWLFDEEEEGTTNPDMKLAVSVSSFAPPESQTVTWSIFKFTIALTCSATS